MNEAMTSFLDDLIDEVEEGPLDQEVRQILFDYLGRAYEQAQLLAYRQESIDD